MSLKDFSAQDHVAITTLGMEFAVAEMLGVGLGFWLDKKWGTLPWMLLAGAVLGFAWGFYIVWRGAQEMGRQEKLKGKKR